MAGASGEATPTTGTPAPAADPPPAADPAPAPAATPEPPPADSPGRLNLTQAQLDDRLSRARAASVRQMGSDFGIENEDQMRAVLERDRAAQTQAETDRQTAMTREQQLQEQLTASQAAQVVAEEAAEMAQFQALIHGTCNQMGIRNTAYAEHMILDAAARSTEDEFDEKAFLEQLLQNPQQAAALGVDGPPTTETGVTTVPGNGVDDPPAPTQPAPPGSTNAMKMTAEQYRAHRASLTGGGGSTFG